MITIHHLEDSRSQRILWLLEELGAEYVIQNYQRDKTTNLAPAALKQIHELGRAPLMSVGDLVLAESAVIIEYLLEHHNKDKKFVVADDLAAQQAYKFWMHFAEGSLMPAMVTKMVLNKGKSKVAFPFNMITDKFVDGVLNAYFGPNLFTSMQFVDDHLKHHHGFLGEQLCGADFQMIFPLEAMVASGQAKQWPAVMAYVKRIHQREAYKRALEKGGTYAYATSE